MLEASVDRDAPSASGGSTGFPPDHPDPIDPRWFALVIASVSVPLLVAVAVLRTPRWYPIGDLAQAELRTRDVGTANSPLLGLVGRIGTLQEPGSHPGPISFWAMAPVYRALGSSAFALRTAAASIHLVAWVAALWLVRRRAAGSPLAFVWVALLSAVLFRAAGPLILTEPWNHLPVSAWYLLLVSTWSLLCRDRAAIPIAVAAATFCAQTHISYLGNEAIAVIHLAVGTGAAARWRGRPDVSEVVTADPRTPTERREFTELKTTVITRLRAAGLADLADSVDVTLFVAAIDPRLPDDLTDEMDRLVGFGAPATVFVAPASSAPR